MYSTQGVQWSTKADAPPAYRPIEHYGVIGDCRTAALVGPDGSIDWCCLPHFDSPAVFCRLLDATRGGYFRVAPTGPYDAAMRYLDQTNVLQTLFTAGGGRVELVDLMPERARNPRALRPSAQLSLLLGGGGRRLRAGRESALGNDVAAAHRILRLVTCQEGMLDIGLSLFATFDYARQPASVALASLGDTSGAILDAGRHFLVLVVRRLAAGGATRTNAPIQLEVHGQEVRARTTVWAGDRLAVALNYARSEREAKAQLAALADHDFDRDLSETLGFWRDWVTNCRYEGPYGEAVRRSALALKLCTFEPTGAIVAAPTASLPEALGGPRNWDYRYTWLRDSALMLDALGALGFHDEARDYFHFLHDLHTRRVADLRIMYGIRGESGEQIAERTLDYLEGYRASRPVRIGNGAALQRQMDVYGELLEAASQYVQASGFRRGRRAAEPMRDVGGLSRQIADYVTDHWRDLDHGIWEIRGAPRAFVYSRVMCWVALDRACKLAGHGVTARRLARWAAAREAIRQDVLRHGVDPQRHRFTMAYGDAHLDAANLLIPQVGFLPPGDELVRETIRATAAELAGPHGLLYRYEPANAQPAGAPPVQSTLDTLPGTEGAFLACTFWLIRDLCAAGELDEARTRFEQLLGYESPLGLYAEELDPATGAMLGNYPQALTHVGVIVSAVALWDAQQGTPAGRPGEPRGGASPA